MQHRILYNIKFFKLCKYIKYIIIFLIINLYLYFYINFIINANNFSGYLFNDKGNFIKNLKRRILPTPNLIIKIDMEFKALSFKYKLCINEIKI